MRHTTAARRAGVLLLTGAAVLAVYLVTLAPGLTWANDGADGGDLITAAAVLGVPHPTGYPTYVLLAHLFQQLPLASLALRTNLFSAVCAALAAIVTGWTAARWYAGRTRYGAVGGLIAALGFGLSSGLWSQAVIAEVYALQTLLTALITASLLWLSNSDADEYSWAFASGVLVGVALGNHLTTALLLPAWLVALLIRRGRARWRETLTALLGLGLGALVYLYIPLRAAAQPAVNWGGATNWAGLWWLISGQPYQALVFHLPPAHMGERVQAWAGLLAGQFGWLGLAGAAYGLFFGRARGRWPLLWGAWLFVSATVFAIGYNTADSLNYLLPAFLAGAIWLGLGAATVLEQISGPRPAWLSMSLAALMAGALTVHAVRQLPSVDASRDTRAEDFGRTVLAQAPSAAAILTTADRDTFALWYFRLALGQRPDTAVVVDRMLPFEWYRQSLRATFGGLVVPESAASGDWAAALISVNARPWCRTNPDLTPVVVCQP